jgi:hypothetical protein
MYIDGEINRLATLFAPCGALSLVLNATNGTDFEYSMLKINKLNAHLS